MIVKFKLRIPDVADYVGIFDNLRVYRSTTGEVGDLTLFRTIPLDAAVVEYVVVDGSGDAEYLYESRLWDSVGDEESDPIDTRLGALDPALQILSVDDLKTRYLFGIDMRDDNGNPFSDSLFEHYIRAAVAKAEQLLDLPIITRTIVDERHDFYRRDYAQYLFVKTEQSPIIDVTEFRIVLPSNTQIVTFPTDWLQVERLSGQIQVVPGDGATGVLAVGSTGAWLPLVYGWTDFIPQIFRISYTAGFADGVPANIVDIIGKLASFGPLGVAGDLILGAGIASESIGLDGVNTAVTTTQSATNAGYGARINQYRRELADEIPDIRQYWRGLRIAAV